MVLNRPPMVPIHTHSKSTPNSMANSKHRVTKLPQFAPTVEGMAILQVTYLVRLGASSATIVTKRDILDDVAGPSLARVVRDRDRQREKWLICVRMQPRTPHTHLMPFLGLWKWIGSVFKCHTHFMRSLIQGPNARPSPEPFSTWPSRMTFCADLL